MLLKLVYVDGLTTIFNRRYFDIHFKKLTNEVRRTKQDIALLIVDIDYFKRFNDNYGHVLGDDTLKRVALVIQKSLQRPADFVARYGGKSLLWYCAKRIEKVLLWLRSEFVIASSKRILNIVIHPFQRLA